MKRIKLDDLEMTNRATKGNRVFKLIKSKEINVTSSYLCKPYETLIVYDKEMKRISCKDISLMGLDATFSKTSEFSKDYFAFVDRDYGIETVRIVDFPQEYKQESEIVQLNIFE